MKITTLTPLHVRSMNRITPKPLIISKQQDTHTFVYDH